MLFKSQVLTQASGSVGGITASRNRFGMYFRARSLPVNPNTSYQQIVRDIVRSLSTSWLDVLTPAQRQAWNVYASNVSWKNRVGDTVFLTGLNHYVRGNAARLQAGLSVVNDGPSVFALPTLTLPSISLDAGEDEIDVVFNNDDDWANEVGGALVCYASRPISPTREFFVGPYRFMNVIEGAAEPPTSPATLSAPYAFEVGQKIACRFVALRADGRASSPFRADAIAAA